MAPLANATQRGFRLIGVRPLASTPEICTQIRREGFDPVAYPLLSVVAMNSGLFCVRRSNDRKS